MNNSFVFYVPKSSPVGDLLAALVYFGRPVVSYVLDENGAEVTIMAQAQDTPDYAGYVRAHGLTRPVKMVASQAVMDAPKSVALKTESAPGIPVRPSIFASVNLDAVMAYSVTGLKAWIAAHSAELSQKDVEMMINWEKSQKKPRVTIIKGLEVLFGGE